MTSLYDISVPVMTNVLTCLSALLKKGEAWAKENNVSSSDLLAYKIYDDMLPLSMQVYIVAATTKKSIERLTGAAPPEVGAREKTLEEWYAIIEQTLKELNAVKKAELDAKEGMEVECKFFAQNYKTNAAEYVHGYAVPTVYFHVNIAYAILRGKGVPLGKHDYQLQFMKKFQEIEG